jgi:hypothetical protein
MQIPINRQFEHAMNELIEKYFAKIDQKIWFGCENAVTGASCCQECCSKQYFNGRQIDYTCEQKRKVYLLRYLPVHAYEVYLGAARISQAFYAGLVSKDPIRIVSLGAGPGSDIVALKRILIDKVVTAKAIDVETLRIDTIPEWNTIATDVIDLQNSDQFKFRHLHKQLDLTQKTFCPDQGFDIISMSYLISELQLGDIPRLSATIKNCLTDRTVILINDRNEGAVVNKIQMVLAGIKGTPIDRDTSLMRSGVIYPEHIRDMIRPKRLTKSIRFTMVASK